MQRFKYIVDVIINSIKRYWLDETDRVSAQMAGFFGQRFDSVGNESDPIEWKKGSERIKYKYSNNRFHWLMAAEEEEKVEEEEEEEGTKKRN